MANMIYEYTIHKQTYLCMQILVDQVIQKMLVYLNMC